MARRYPDFILEVEKQLKEGGLSDTGFNLGIFGFNFDSVKNQKGEEAPSGREGNDQGSTHLNGLLLIDGVRSV
jgi:hypothetical protein